MYFSHSAVVELVKYPYYEYVGQDHENGEDEVLIVVYMPSGQDNRKIEVKIHEGGMKMSIFEVYPSIFLDSNYVREQSAEIISNNTAKMKGFKLFIFSKLLAIVNGKRANKVLKEMQIDLPIPCEEVPTLHKKRQYENEEEEEDKEEDKPVVLHEHDDPTNPSSRQKVQLLYIELIGKNRQERHQIGRASEWRDESDSEDSEESQESDLDELNEATPVFNNNSTKKSWFPSFFRRCQSNPPLSVPRSPTAEPSALTLESIDHSYNHLTLKDLDDASTIKTGASTKSFINRMTKNFVFSSDESGVVSDDDATKLKLTKAHVF